MNTTAILMKEIETMPEEAAVQVLDFVMFLKNRHSLTQSPNSISIKDAFGIFKDLKGKDTVIERDDDRI